mgnify:CR=1 FL=1
MEAIVLLKTLNKMCKSYDACDSCAICVAFDGCPINYAPYRQNPETYSKLMEIVEEWLKEHPPGTRGQLFFDHNPEAKRCDSYPNVPDVRPCDYDESVNFPARCCRFDCCDYCRKEYWEEPV